MKEVFINKCKAEIKRLEELRYSYLWDLDLCSLSNNEYERYISKKKRIVELVDNIYATTCMLNTLKDALKDNK